MKLDKELGRLTVEHGTMRGPPTDQERLEESARKQLANRVRGGGVNIVAVANVGLLATVPCLARCSFFPSGCEPSSGTEGFWGGGRAPIWQAKGHRCDP